MNGLDEIAVWQAARAGRRALKRAWTILQGMVTDDTDAGDAGAKAGSVIRQIILESEVLSANLLRIAGRLQVTPAEPSKAHVPTPEESTRTLFAVSQLFEVLKGRATVCTNCQGIKPLP